MSNFRVLAIKIFLVIGLQFCFCAFGAERCPASEPCQALSELKELFLEARISMRAEVSIPLECGELNCNIIGCQKEQSEADYLCQGVEDSIKILNLSQIISLIEQTDRVDCLGQLCKFLMHVLKRHIRHYCDQKTLVSWFGRQLKFRIEKDKIDVPDEIKPNLDKMRLWHKVPIENLKKTVIWWAEGVLDAEEVSADDDPEWFFLRRPAVVSVPLPEKLLGPRLKQKMGP